MGYIDPIAVNTDGNILGGHARKKVLQELKVKEVDVRVPNRLLTEKEVEETCIRLNKNVAGEWDFDMLANLFDTADLIDWGFEPGEFGILAGSENESLRGSLSERFLVPPFSVLNAREG